MAFHVTRVENSEKLQAILAFMKTMGDAGATTFEISECCNVLNVATYLSHLKHNGYQFRKKYERKNNNGSFVYRYFYIGKVEKKAKTVAAEPVKQGGIL